MQRQPLVLDDKTDGYRREDQRNNHRSTSIREAFFTHQFRLLFPTVIRIPPPKWRNHNLHLKTILYFIINIWWLFEVMQIIIFRMSLIYLINYEKMEKELFNRSPSVDQMKNNDDVCGIERGRKFHWLGCLFTRFPDSVI